MRVTRRDHVAQAVGWMGCMIVAFLLQMIAVRELSDTLSVFQILFIRNAVSMTVLLPVLLTRGPGILRTRRIGLHITRNMANFFGQAAWVYGVTLLPLAAVTALEFSTPIWVAIFATLFLGETLSRHRIVAVALGFVGVMVILRPGVEAVQTASLVVLASAALFAASNVMVKALTSTEDTIAIVMWMQIIQLPIGLVAALFAWSDLAWSDLPWLLLTGCTALVAHWSMARAFFLADATLVMPIDFLRLPIAAVVAFLVYSERLNMFVFLGAALIFVGNFYSVWRERRAHKD